VTSRSGQIPPEVTARRVEGLGRTLSLGGGVQVPYPIPSSPAATTIGKGNRRTGTRPELALRSEVHRRGLRYRVDHLLRVGEVKVRPDLVFTKARLAVFMDGCFWHGCPEHGRRPVTNPGYWGPKLDRNLIRDRQVNQCLLTDGWAVIRVWEHEPAGEAADRIVALFRVRRGLTDP
jgi:DNA mismatch endonuclease, patch repair protein